MSRTIACLKGKMGSTDYYLATMKAGELINSVGFASEIAEWEDLDLDERMQREIQEKRVIEEIVPYVINDRDRLFGALVVDIYQGWEQVEYESLKEVAKVPRAYQDQLDSFGFLSIPGNQSLIALDGQHRLLALSVAIKGWSGLRGGTRLSEELKESLKPHPELIDEDISVIFVKHTDSVKIRKIFNKINRYAKQTSRGDNIITDEDDLFAIIARRIMKPNQPLAPINHQDLVNWSSNTLAKKSRHLTTISAVYTFAEEILADLKIDRKFRPKDTVVEKRYSQVAEIWEKLIEGLDDFREYVSIIEGMSDNDISELREQSLLLKPVTQMALAVATRLALKRGVDLDTIIERLNRISWEMTNDLWKGVLVIPGTTKVMSGKTSIQTAGRLIAYLVAGEHYSDTEKMELFASLSNLGNKSELPEPISMAS